MRKGRVGGEEGQGREEKREGVKRGRREVQGQGPTPNTHIFQYILAIAAAGYILKTCRGESMVASRPAIAAPTIFCGLATARLVTAIIPPM